MPRNLNNIIEDNSRIKGMKNRQTNKRSQQNRQIKKQVQQNKPVKTQLKQEQDEYDTRRISERIARLDKINEARITERKKKIVEKYGTEPTITYFYYLWNAVDYVGEKSVRDSFESIKGQGNVIVGNYSSTDNTKKIAEEYGFKVVDIEKSEGILLHESKIVNKVIFESKSNFLVDLNVHTIYPNNTNEFFTNWLKDGDVTKHQLVARGLMHKSDGTLERIYSASCLFYKPYLIEARGFDERTYYGLGTTPYVISLLLDVYKLIWDDRPLDMVHSFHKNVKWPYIKEKFKITNSSDDHVLSTQFGESLIDELVYNFGEGVKQVKNSYW